MPNRNSRSGAPRCRPRLASALAAWTTFAAAATAAEGISPAPGCTLEAGPRRAVVRVIDAETVTLDDTTEVRLVGALAPRAPDSRVAGDDWLPEREARAALAALVQGRTVELAFAGRRSDRYGRVLAHLFVEAGGHRIWVQGEMLAQGHARAYGLPQNSTCLDAMLAREAEARTAGRGLWSNAAYAARFSSDGRQLRQLRDTYQLVEGRIVRASQGRTHVYLNFGADWRRDFTAGVALDRSRRGWAADLLQLEGRRVRVRGWIEWQNGPYIAINDPAQIEVLPDELPAEPRPATRKSKRGSKALELPAPADPGDDGSPPAE